MSLWRMVSRKRCLENDGRNGFWDLEAIETSDCHWKLEGEIGSFSAQGPFEIIETNLGFLRCWGAVLFGLQAPVVKTHGSSDAKAVYSTIRQIRTMLETDVVGKSVKELSKEG